jgi:hypothetical protein
MRILAGPHAGDSPEVGCFLIKSDTREILAGTRAGDSPEVGCFLEKLTHAQYLQDHVLEILRKWVAFQ